MVGINEHFHANNFVVWYNVNVANIEYYYIKIRSLFMLTAMNQLSYEYILKRLGITKVFA